MEIEEEARVCPSILKAVTTPEFGDFGGVIATHQFKRSRGRMAKWLLVLAPKMETEEEASVCLSILKAVTPLSSDNFGRLPPIN